MPETLSQPPLEARIGTKVPIKQHECIKGSLGLFGKVMELSYFNVPNVAKCNRCGKNIVVDYKAWRASKDRNSKKSHPHQ